jgi:hypothetical protein
MPTGRLAGPVRASPDVFLPLHWLISGAQERGRCAFVQLCVTRSIGEVG